MKTAAPTLLLALSLVLAGCSDPAPVAPAPVPRAVEAKKVDTLNDMVNKALLVGTNEDLLADRALVRQWRGGGEANPAIWPNCERVAKAYMGVAALKTLVGVQDALAAAQVDDYVLCDQAHIFGAAKQGAELAIARLAPELAGKGVSLQLANSSKVAKIDTCWLESLRESRQTHAPYNEAAKRADARCTKL